MKKIFLSFAFIQSILLNAQTQIDGNVYVTFPGKIEEKIDTLSKGAISRTFCYNSKKESYMVMKTSFNNFKKFTDEDKLKQFYTTLSNDYIESLNNKGLELSNLSYIKLHDLLALKLNFIDKSSKKQNGELIMLYTNDAHYLFIYSEILKFNKSHKQAFFDSIILSQNLEQYKKQD